MQSKKNSKHLKALRAYTEALRAMQAQKPNVRQALALLQTAAQEGLGDAIYALGTWHLFGKPPYVKKDEKQGARLILEAAELGIVDAMYDAAASYELATGVRRNLKKAFEYYMRAAIRGDADAVNEVARCYHWGIGIERDRRVSRLWYERAKEVGTER